MKKFKAPMLKWKAWHARERNETLLRGLVRLGPSKKRKLFYKQTKICAWYRSSWVKVQLEQIKNRTIGKLEKSFLCLDWFETYVSSMKHSINSGKEHDMIKPQTASGPSSLLSFLAINTCQQPFTLLSWAAGVRTPMCDLMKDTLPV